MGDTFRGWRRKTGIVTLIFACLSTMIWIQGEVLGHSGRGWHISLFPQFQTQLNLHMDADSMHIALTIAGGRQFQFRFAHWPVSIYLSLYFSLFSLYLLVAKTRRVTTSEPL